MRKRFVLLSVATPLFALNAFGLQYPSTYPGQTPSDLPYGQGQQSTQLNCNDPAAAQTPECANGGEMPYPVMPAPTSSGTESPAGAPGRVATFYDEGSRSRSSAAGANQVPLRPEPLTEFQKFVVSTTGQLLPLYGAQLFTSVPTTFAPLENTPVPPDYVLGPDDELRIRVWGQVNFLANVRVDRAGEVYLPQVGEVHVAGLRFAELDQHLHDAIARVYRNFQLQVEMGEIRSVQVYVTGEARRPGLYTVSSLSTLVDALFASGGPSVQGSMRRIQLRRGGTVVTTLDLYALLVNGDKTHDAKLLPGDVIYIPPAGPQAAIIGSVRRPAIYELLPGETLDALLRDAGGTTSLASDTRTSIDRNDNHSGRQTMEVRLDTAGLATAVDDGDIIHVLSLVSRYEKTVTLRGNTANPGRFAWHDGMRLSDLIPDRQSLLTRDYWWKRAQLGLPAPEFEPIPGLTTMRQPSHPVDLVSYGAAQPPARGAAARPQGQQPVSSDDAYQDSDVFSAQPSAAQTTPSGMGAGAIGAAAAAQQGQAQRNGGVPSSQAALGEETEAANAQNRPMTARNVVRQTSPDIDWSYAVIERTDPVSLKTTLVPFDLGKLVIDHDASQDLQLQPGDVVTIFSQADIPVPIAEQTKLVRLEGEFVHSGTYSALPGETLRQLIDRAGGLTPNAYLYGSVFTRESTRALQQRRIDEFVQQMTMEMQRGNLALAASPVSNAQDLASVSAAQGSEQALVAELQQIRANGRIVFQFRPDSAGVVSIPDIKLENGDTFLVPSVPTTVNVLGAVFNQNSFVYRPDSRVRALLDQAGGPNTYADRRRMFIVRANGAVVSRTSVKSVWGDEFFRLRLYPGDTLIVPEKIIKPSALRGLLDWTQIFSQLAFGVAAINVIQ